MKKGYDSLLAALNDDLQQNNSHHDYQATFDWAIERAKHYAEKLCCTWEEVLTAWETDRTYWYMNYYQDCKQPLIKGETVKVFGFRCPKCSKVSKNPQKCTQDGCDWKAFGFFGTLGKGATVILKNSLTPIEIFIPVAWEQDGEV